MEVFESAEGMVTSRGGFRSDLSVTENVDDVDGLAEEVRGTKAGPVDFGRIIWKRLETPV